MRTGRVIDWVTVLETSPEELHRRLRGLWQEQEDLYAREARIREQLHACPDRELDSHLMKAERHIAQAAVLLGEASVDSARVRY